MPSAAWCGEGDACCLRGCFMCCATAWRHSPRAAPMPRLNCARFHWTGSWVSALLQCCSFSLPLMRACTDASLSPASQAFQSPAAAVTGMRSYHRLRVCAEVCSSHPLESAFLELRDRLLAGHVRFGCPAEPRHALSLRRTCQSFETRELRLGRHRGRGGRWTRFSRSTRTCCGDRLLSLTCGARTFGTLHNAAPLLVCSDVVYHGSQVAVERRRWR